MEYFDTGWPKYHINVAFAIFSTISLYFFHTFDFSTFCHIFKIMAIWTSFLLVGQFLAKIFRYAAKNNGKIYKKNSLNQFLSNFKNSTFLNHFTTFFIANPTFLVISFGHSILIMFLQTFFLKNALLYWLL